MDCGAGEPSSWSPAIGAALSKATKLPNVAHWRITGSLYYALTRTPFSLPLSPQLQAFFLVADDIMDQSITRRGQPCWYKLVRLGSACSDGLCGSRLLPKSRPFACQPRPSVLVSQEDVGLVAINDSFLIQAAVFKLLKRHFRAKPYYVELLELMNEVRQIAAAM